jgi:hypothetical protein
MSHAVAGLLGTIPVLCMGLLAPLGPVLAASIGPKLGAAACVSLVAVFGVARAFAPDATTVLLATVGLGVGMALVGPILPMIVRARLPNHPAAGTGAYVIGFVIGGTITAAVAVPLADATDGWRGSFAIVSAFGFASLGAWLWLMPRDEGHVRVAPSRPKLPWRRPSAWLLGAIFGSQSILFYGCITWIGSVYVERGWAPGAAGSLIALLTGIGLVSTLAVPLFADRFGTRRSQLTIAALLSVAGAPHRGAHARRAAGLGHLVRRGHPARPGHRRVLPARADAAGGRRERLGRRGRDLRVHAPDRLPAGGNVTGRAWHRARRHGQLRGRRLDPRRDQRHDDSTGARPEPCSTSERRRVGSAIERSWSVARLDRR